MSSQVTRTVGDDASERFYAIQKYPGPEALITYVWANRLKPYLGDGAFRFLDAGCGSGRHVAGLLLRYEQASGVAIDLSQPSLDEAHALVAAKGIEGRVRFERLSFSTPLPFEAEFDLALAAGTVHHSPDPTQSLCNIAATVKPGGIVAGMIYGQRGQARRYEIREMLDLMQSAAPDVSKRDLYAAFRRKYGGYMDLTPREMIARWRKRLSRLRRRLAGTLSDYGYYAGDKPMADLFFEDAMLTPIDVAVDSRQLEKMFDAAGLELAELFTFGRPDPGVLPTDWRAIWNQLSPWDQIRVCELMDPLPTSFSFVARKGA
jgi:SAM-dependent methyltransferase